MKPEIVLIAVFFLQWNGSTQAGAGPNIVYPVQSGDQGPVVFSHRSHDASGAGYGCRQCHESESGGVSAGAGAVRGKSFCVSCHDGKTTGSRRPSPAASIQACSSCHMPGEDIVIRLNRMDPVSFSHVKHFGIEKTGKPQNSAGFSCGDCHPEPFDKNANGRIEMELPHSKGGCAECHNGKPRSDGLPQAFAADTRCLTCHIMP